ncbi:MAG: toll/interleukin-1 receptor domain-containing protein [Rubrivivax sp.]|nr:toll/interleukin-1 receptor domain-containing protein [Rubrivivax sp.]
MSGFEQHAFISYAHIDNQALEPGHPGWVTRFHEVLEARLAELLGGAVIWRDRKLAGNDDFGDEIEAQLRRSALLVSVLTPRYVDSQWCVRELQTFVEAADPAGPRGAGSAQRVILVRKTPLSSQAKLPPVFERMLGFAFFDKDKGQLSVYDPLLGETARQAFHHATLRLAEAMADTLRGIGAAQLSADAPPPSGQVVYLAHGGRDMESVRQQLAAELRAQGHAVLPDGALPLDEESLAAVVQPALEAATLAVHLVGSSGGPVPEGPSGLSVVELQNRWAAQASAQRRLPRLIWAPAAARPERAEHERFIQALLSQGELQQGADLLRGDLEELKTTLHQSLRPRPKAQPPAAQAGAVAVPRVHLVLTEADRRLALPVIQALRSAGAQVSLPEFAGEAAEIRQLNATRAAEADAVLIGYGSGDEAWRVHQQLELRKLGALLGRPLPAPWLLLWPPDSEDKRLQQALAEPRTLDALDGLQPQTLEPLRAFLSRETR